MVFRTKVLVRRVHPSAQATRGLASGILLSVNTHSFPRFYTAMHLLPTLQVAVTMGVGS